MYVNYVSKSQCEILLWCCINLASRCFYNPHILNRDALLISFHQLRIFDVRHPESGSFAFHLMCFCSLVSRKTPRKFGELGEPGEPFDFNKHLHEIGSEHIGLVRSVSQICRLVVPGRTISCGGSNQQFWNIQKFSQDVQVDPMVQFSVLQRSCCLGEVYFFQSIDGCFP